MGNVKLLATVCLIAGAGCDAAERAPDADLPTWEEYRDAARREFESYVSYVLDGDEPTTLDELRAHYDRYVEWHARERAGFTHTEQYSTINVVGGADDIWPFSVRANLTYCISTAFGANHARTVAEMAQATADWEAHGDYNFVYVPSQDGACTNANPNVVFAVRPWTGSGACAFFPSGGGCVPRTLVMNYASFASGAVTSQGVFRHELGHILGLRHEHIRAPGTSCIEGGTFRGVTAYDSASVMHYPWCTGATNTGDLFITSNDALGINTLYSSSFQAWARTPNAKAVGGDFNGDGRDDIALAGGTGWWTIPVAFSNGDGTFTITNHTNTSFASWASAPGAKLVAGDFNNDGYDDLALAGGAGWWTIPVAFSNGNGTFTISNASVSSFPDWAMAATAKLLAGDVDADGDDDLILTGGEGWWTIPVAFSNGNGTFTVTNQSSPSFAGWAQSPTAKVGATDLDGDGDVDLAITGGEGWWTIPMAFSNRNGSFTITNFAHTNFPVWSPSNTVQLATGDTNLDGRGDLILTGGTGWWTIPTGRSNGNGTLAESNPEVGSFPGWAQALNARAVGGDFNGDGRTDLALVGGTGWWTMPLAFSNAAGSYTVSNQRLP